MRGLWWLGVLMLVLTAGNAAWAETRSPADLVPAEVGVYAEINLNCLAGESTDTQALQEVFGVSKLIDLARQSLAADPEMGKEMEQVFTLITSTGKGLGWRVGAGLSVDMSSLMGGAPPHCYVVAHVADAAACAQAMAALRTALPKSLSAPRTEGDLKLTDLAGSDAVVAQGKDWIAFTYPAAAISDIAALASGKSTSCLAADPKYQQATAVVPADAVFMEYTSAALLQQSMGLAAIALPGVKLPEPPKDGSAWALSFKVEDIMGRRILKGTWQTDLAAAAFAMQGPVAGALAPVVSRARESARKAQCLSNVKNLALAMNMFVADHGKYPKADTWVAELAEYSKSATIFKCPGDASAAKCSYGMNWSLSGKPASAVKDPAERVVFYETANPGDCPRGGKTDLALPPRHVGGNNYGYADGHAKWVPEGAKGAGSW